MFFAKNSVDIEALNSCSGIDNRKIENLFTYKFIVPSSSTQGLPLGRTFVPTPSNWG